MNFEDFALEKGQAIEEVFQNFVELLSGKTIDDIVACELADMVNEFLEDKGAPFCYPYWEGDEETPCYLGDTCKVGLCPYIVKGEGNASEG